VNHTDLNTPPVNLKTTHVDPNPDVNTTREYLNTTDVDPTTDLNTTHVNLSTQKLKLNTPHLLMVGVHVNTADADLHINVDLHVNTTDLNATHVNLNIIQLKLNFPVPQNSPVPHLLQMEDVDLHTTDLHTTNLNMKDVHSTDVPLRDVNTHTDLPSQLLQLKRNTQHSRLLGKVKLYY